MIFKYNNEIGQNLFRMGLLLLSTVFVVACSQTVQTPTPVPPTLTEEPTLESTLAPIATATVAPTITPSRAPTNTRRPSAQIHFDWDPAGVRPSDSDDVTAIVDEISDKEGILSGYGNEQGITLQYDPTLITVEEIQEILERIGHPVMLVDE